MWRSRSLASAPRHSQVTSVSVPETWSMHLDCYRLGAHGSPTVLALVLAFCVFLAPTSMRDDSTSGTIARWCRGRSNTTGSWTAGQERWCSLAAPQGVGESQLACLRLRVNISWPCGVVVVGWFIWRVIAGKGQASCVRTFLMESFIE